MDSVSAEAFTIPVVTRSSSIKPLFKPLPEQQRALSLFQRQEGLRIDAYAGTGKTTTLQYLSANTRQHGLYLAFNRSIAIEARSRFTSRVSCTTTHSIAFRGVKKAYRYPEWKLTEPISAIRIAEAFHLPEMVSFNSGLLLPRGSYASALLGGLRRFLQSDDEAPRTFHMLRQGALANLTDASFLQFSEQAVFHLRAIWNAMRDKQGGLPLGHDGYLKLWALSTPRARADYIMVDEAQDLNPVLLGVLKSLDCPTLYVGDPFQQIYDWRGAVNAMEAVASRHRVLLSQSFRFGPEIASAATVVLKTLGARAPLLGSPTMVSHIGRVRPDAILARSNSGVITNVLNCLSRNIRCAVVGGTRDLKRILTDVERIKQGGAASIPELLGFQTWKEVMDFSVQPGGESLRSLVNLVQEHGERRLLAALDRCEEKEDTAQVVCSTAHRAKGREWNYVRLDPDFEGGFKRSEGTRRPEAKHT